MDINFLFSVIDNSEKGFDKKIQKLGDAVLKYLGFQTSYNFHKRFLMKNYDYNEWIFGDHHNFKSK